MEAEAQNFAYFILHLLRGAEEVGIVLGEAPNAHKAVEGARTFEAVDGSQFGPAEGEIPVGVLGVLVDHHVEGAVHRLDVVVGIVHYHVGVHALGVEIQMTRGFPEPAFTHVGGEDDFIAVLDVLPTPEIFHGHPNSPAFGMPVHQSGAGLFLEAEEIQFPAEAAVVAFFQLSKVFEVGLELSGFVPGGAVDALEHGAFLVPAPVGSGDAQKLEAPGVQASGGFHVGSPAEVDEITHPVEGYLFAFGEIVDEFDFVGLLPEEIQGVGAGNHLFLEGMIGFDHPGHMTFDEGEVFGGEFAREIEIVVEAVFDGRSDGEFGLGEHFEDAAGHNMGHGMAHAVEFFDFLLFFRTQVGVHDTSERSAD